MKPKHRIVCPQCKRQKLLFESEKKALLHIKYNGDETAKESGFAPVRAYYCEACCGWHLTSRPANSSPIEHTLEYHTIVRPNVGIRRFRTTPFGIKCVMRRGKNNTWRRGASKCEVSIID